MTQSIKFNKTLKCELILRQCWTVLHNMSAILIYNNFKAPQFNSKEAFTNSMSTLS